MKITKLILHNIGAIADIALDINKPLILLYGEIRQGKSTVLNGVRWVCGGEFPADIIRHGEKEAFVEMQFDGGLIRREWYIAKDGATKARAVQFVQNGRPVDKPVAALQKFLNPFLLNQDHLKDKNEGDRKAFFTELFGVDTSALDREAFDTERKASDLRSQIKGYGEIDLTKIETVDATALKASLATIRFDYSRSVESWQQDCDRMTEQHDQNVAIVNLANLDARQRSIDRNGSVTRIKSLRDQIAELQKRIETANELLQEEQVRLTQLPELAQTPLPNKPTLPVKPAAPDTSKLEADIQNAAAQNVRAEQYAKNLARDKQRQADQTALDALVARGREIKAEKSAKLKGISDTCGVKGLAFDDEGNFRYEDTDAGMLSTSQIMRLSSDLSAMYPEGMGLALLDRAESLGKSIFGFVEKANAQKLTILATIVGEAPAESPPEIGVFVVSDGKIK